MNSFFYSKWKPIIVFLVIAALFYLYIPPQTGYIESMNTTVGENKIDVLFVGSSHVFNGINPIQMYEDYGVAGYDLAVGAQTPWQSYYYIKEACKHQQPKLIVYDAYTVGSSQNEDDYQDYQTVNNLLNCRISINKIKAVLASKSSDRLGLILRFPYAHDEYEKYWGATFSKIKGDKKPLLGYAYNNSVQKLDMPIINQADSIPISSKNEKYLRMIIEFCQENNINLLLTNTPYPDITDEKEGHYNYIGDVANEYGVGFINGCDYIEEIGLDYTYDCLDVSHLNHSGVTKYTAWLEKYIKSNYDLPDRRNNLDYAVYEESVEELNRLIESGSSEELDSMKETLVENE